MNSITVQALDKKLLRAILAISKSTLTRFMNLLRPEILLIDSRYKSNSQILRKDVFIYICEESGLSREDIAQRVKNHCPNYREANIEDIKGIYGLND